MESKLTFKMIINVLIFVSLNQLGFLVVKMINLLLKLCIFGMVILGFYHLLCKPLWSYIIFKT